MTFTLPPLPYAYDALGQLTSFTRSDGQSESYAYDPVGNMTAKM